MLWLLSQTFTGRWVQRAVGYTIMYLYTHPQPSVKANVLIVACGIHRGRTSHIDTSFLCSHRGRLSWVQRRTPRVPMTAMSTSFCGWFRSFEKGASMQSIGGRKASRIQVLRRKVLGQPSLGWYYAITLQVFPHQINPVAMARR